MNLTKAKYSGFCFGVKKALDIVDNLKGDNAYILGELIHNPQVIEKLKERGIQILEDINDITKGTIVISAHGMPDSAIKQCKGLNVIDATCPLVKKVHMISKEFETEGFTTLIFGDKHHQEVKGTAGNLKDCLIASNIEELKALDLNRKIGIVSQTTQEVEEFNQIVDYVKDKAKETKVYNTICSATRQRQEAAAELAKTMDLVIVIGGYNSANTVKLKDICSEITETKHIESADELKEEWFKGKQNIGITAGASTPEWVIEEVIDKISSF
jgi:4-hydroxy-3-methylbut-2-enyl diphosphate reductase